MNIIYEKYDEFFLEIALPVMKHQEYQKMKQIPHHHGSVFNHSLAVAWLSYRIALRLKLDVVSIIRGALLHDFYLYKYKKRENKNFLIEGLRHSRNHPRIARENALKYFELNHREVDIISNHMFPMGLPRCYEAWITTFADKSLAIVEYSSRVLSVMYLRRQKAVS